MPEVMGSSLVVPFGLAGADGGRRPRIDRGQAGPRAGARASGRVPRAGPGVVRVGARRSASPVVMCRDDFGDVEQADHDSGVGLAHIARTGRLSPPAAGRVVSRLIGAREG